MSGQDIAAAASPAGGWSSLDLSSVAAAAVSYKRIGLSPLRVHGTERDNGMVRCTCKKEDCTRNAGKHPVSKGWSKERLSAAEVAEQFAGPTPWNVGVLFGIPSGGLTDVDHDCPESLALAAAFLPPTECVFGRASKPDSHWEYIVTPAIKPAPFTDPDGKMLVEIRSTGGQTVMPPSIHQSGEVIAFSKQGAPAQVDGPDLRARVARLAAACLVLRGWPREKGGRWKRAGALAGGLLRAGWTVEDVKEFIRAIAEAAGDDEVEARVASVDTTSEKLKKGEEVAGWPKLGELIGNAEVQLVCKYLGIKTRTGSASPQRASTPIDEAARYSDDGAGLLMLKQTPNGPAPVRLTNFTARIVTDVIEDDGVEKRRTLEVQSALAGREPARHVIAAEEFWQMRWPLVRLGPKAIVYPGNSSEAHTVAAIQTLSDTIASKTVYTHTGWTKIGGAWYYLHGAGAVGAEGTVKHVEVALTGTLAHYSLPDPPSGSDLTTAIHAAFTLLALAPPRVAYAVFSAIFRAILGDVDFSEFIVGHTGVFKTEYAALIQRFFGIAFDARHLPGSWTGTDNALEDTAFRAKDAVLVIDDFKPSGSFSDDKLQQKADRVLRAQANGTGRQRLRSDLTHRPDHPPRGLIISTGEDVPRGQSLRGRSLIHELSKGDITAEKLTECQRLADRGYFGQVTAAFCKWVAPRLDEVRKLMKQRVEILRATYTGHLPGGHARLPGILANLHFGFEMFVTFAVEATGEDALTREESRDKLDKCSAGLRECGAAQMTHQAASDPVERYLQFLSSALAAGKAHVCRDDGRPPAPPAAWGWRDESSTSVTSWKPMGDRIGWVDGDDLYLDPDAAYRVAQAQVADGDRLAVSERTLRKRLFEKKCLVSTEMETQSTYTARRDLQNARRRVLHLRACDVVNTRGDDDGAVDIPV